MFNNNEKQTGYTLAIDNQNQLLMLILDACVSIKLLSKYDLQKSTNLKA
jgi:hypothetical protein